ncbi:hypothetical protein Ais01nite_06520 [Asanoa ishikariensis]|uniref:Putative adhesin n=1 Tax=Asanoa ishikariensis TaxID=137265 RepID=A0A1H3TDJ4_9ACTN|nr:DUF4097 family beta strand repeat-containing protein [Asanoa ishikariensis]GIF62617.1 hypothetical protein Ais01nite_06520 [Asanoa ishikariensis]SDZ48373.1 Putative adhesin [Asanoa ishikariensis]
MPTFTTPGPIDVNLSLVVAQVRITAGDRDTTEVEVRPGSSSASSTKMAEETQVEYANGQLRVRTPKNLTRWLGAKSGRIEVEIALPAGSRLDGDNGAGDLDAEGSLGETRYKTGFGAIRLAETGRLRVNTGAGDITVAHVNGDAEVTTGTGRLHIGAVDGTATVKNSSGETWVGEVGGALRANSANGDIAVDRARGGAALKTANGSLRVLEAVRGRVSLETAAGSLEVGIPTGTAAWLDLDVKNGAVRNTLGGSSGPVEGDETVEVRARTYFGDIMIHRA